MSTGDLRISQPAINPYADNTVSILVKLVITGFMENKEGYKYTAGNASTYSEAVKLQNKVRLNRKYRDAFIVAFRGEERIELDRAAYEKTREAIAGKLPFGSADTVGIADGYIGFVTEHPAYREYLDADLRKKLETHLAALKSGEITVPR